MIEVTQKTGKKIRQENVNVSKHGMTIEDAAQGVIEYVMEDASSKKKKNNGHARVQASASEAINKLWAPKVFGDGDKDAIMPE